MITVIKIQNNMDCNYICNHIHQAIVKYQKENTDLTDSMIIIDIKKVSQDNDYIPKIEHKNINT